MKKISIITANLNCGKYLREALESVFSQNYPNVEHIVLDAVSTDDSIRVLKAWAQEVAGSSAELVDHVNEGSASSADGTYLFKWISEKDKGQTDAINKGFRIATGDVRTWLNADEFYYPGTLRAIADRFEQSPEIDVLYGEAMLTREEGSPLRVRHVHKPDRNVLLYYGCYITSVATFYNGRIFDEGHYLDESYKVTMDFEFYARLWSKGFQFAYFPRIIGSFRLTGDNVSIRLSELRRKERLMVQKQYGFPRKKAWGLPAPILDLLFIVFRLKSVALRFRRQMGYTPEKIT